MKNKLAVGLGLMFCLGSTVGLAGDIAVHPGTSNFMYFKGDAKKYVHNTLKCNLATDGKKMSLRIQQRYGVFGRAELTFDNGTKISSNGSLAGTAESREAELVIYDLVNNSGWLYSDGIEFFNDGQGEAYGNLYVNNCTFTADENTPSSKKAPTPQPCGSDCLPPSNHSFNPPNDGTADGGINSN